MAPTNQPEGCLSDEERARIIQLLEDSQNQFLALVGGLSDAQWVAKSAPDRWSVQQIAEHLVAGEMGMCGKIKEALRNAPHPDWQSEAVRKAHFLERVLPDRSLTAAAPPKLHPTHGWTREETVAYFQAGRARTMQLAADRLQPFKSHCSEHPFPIFNLLSAYHWLLYIPLHNVRHNQQIAEVLKEIAA